MLSISSNVLLRCIVHTETNGIFKVGDTLQEYQHDIQLGVLVSAGFSLKRGRYSGTGFVNAALLLKAMLRFESLVWVNGRREVRVWVKREGCVRRLATLFILL